MDKRIAVLTKENILENDTITLDGRSFDASNLSKFARDNLDQLLFANKQILQKNNEIQIADTARIMYLSVLKLELMEK